VRGITTRAQTSTLAGWAPGPRPRHARSWETSTSSLSTGPVQDLAAEVGGPLLRTLDAWHPASALVLGDAVSAVVCYDARLADAARAAGLTVATPAPPPAAPAA
jgi:hypothetical protein